MRIVDDLNPYWVSPSQLVTFRHCQRKWAYDKIEGLRAQRSTKSQSRGTRAHSYAEEHFKTGALIPGDSDTGRMAQQWAKELSTVDILSVEGMFKWRPGLASLRGIIDLVYEEDGILVVRDHKTTSNLRYAKTTEDLLTDPQAIIYSAYTAEKFNKKGVVFELGYVTPELKTKKVRLPLASDMLEERLEPLLLDAADIEFAIKTKEFATDLPVPLDASVCVRPFPCDYAKLCRIENIRGHIPQEERDKMTDVMANFKANFKTPSESNKPKIVVGKPTTPAPAPKPTLAQPSAKATPSAQPPQTMPADVQRNVRMGFALQVASDLASRQPTMTPLNVAKRAFAVVDAVMAKSGENG